MLTRYHITNWTISSSGVFALKEHFQNLRPRQGKYKFIWTKLIRLWQWHSCAQGHLFELLLYVLLVEIMFPKRQSCVYFTVVKTRPEDLGAWSEFKSFLILSLISYHLKWHVKKSFRENNFEPRYIKSISYCKVWNTSCNGDRRMVWRQNYENCSTHSQPRHIDNEK